MTKMKKILLLLLISMPVLLLTGCGSKNVEGNLEDIMTKIYADIPEEERPMMLMNTQLNDENIENFLGTKDIEYKEALASESATGSIAHSVILVRAKENADVEKIKSKILESVNPRKWICVGVEDEDVIVKSKGDLIIVIIVGDETNRDKLEKGFDNL